MLGCDLLIIVLFENMAVVNLHILLIWKNGCLFGLLLLVALDIELGFDC